MFQAEVYKERRKILKGLVKSGLILFAGNKEPKVNYNTVYRQDSTFMYYWGHTTPDLWAVIDVDNDQDILVGDDRAVDDVVWMGPDISMAEKASLVGVDNTLPMSKLRDKIKEARNKGQQIHFLPQYDVGNQVLFESLLGINHAEINKNVSKALIKAVVLQRSVKSDLEIMEINFAANISYVMNTFAMKSTQPGLYEKDVWGAVEGIALSQGKGISFPTIFSVRGETLHNNYHENLMKEGDLVVLDSGAESHLHYASDITRTFPVSGKFTSGQKDIYNVVLNSQLAAIEMTKPGIPYRDCHFKTAKVITEGLKELGLMKGDVDEAVAAGAHALFFPHGLGHMLGLDAHDMEPLGEDYVGYDDSFKRSDQFGLAYLRLARELQEGFVVTAEPGVYFIPQLIANWKAENKHADFINYDKVEKYIGLGGIRIEDDVLVTSNGSQILGEPIPKTVDEVEEACNL